MSKDMQQSVLAALDEIAGIIQADGALLLAKSSHRGDVGGGRVREALRDEIVIDAKNRGLCTAAKCTGRFR